jgi:hypothetical protein
MQWVSFWLKRCQNRRSNLANTSAHLCVTRDTNAQQLGAKLGIDPTEVLRVINGKTVPTKAAISGLARELDSDVIRKD